MPPPWKWIGLDYLSGERVIAKDVLMPMREGFSALRGFGLEVQMNRSIVAQRLRIKVVLWKDVLGPLKFHKYGWWRGVMGDIQMMGHIFGVISPLEAIMQIRDMRRLRV